MFAFAFNIMSLGKIKEEKLQNPSRGKLLVGGKQKMS
jgi:hypothetical protein